MQKKLAFISIALLAGALSNSAQATMLEQLDTLALTRQSDSIQVGEVTSSWSSMDESKQMIYTYVKMRVDQTLKGKSQSEVLIRLPGGQSSGYGMVVHGMASFKPRERALVFLRNERDGTPTVVGMAQGKFRIVKSLANGEDQALFRAPHNLEFVTRGQQGQVRHVVASHAERRVPLQTLLGEIREAVAQERPISN